MVFVIVYLMAAKYVGEERLKACEKSAKILVRGTAFWRVSSGSWMSHNPYGRSWSSKRLSGGAERNMVTNEKQSPSCGYLHVFSLYPACHGNTSSKNHRQKSTVLADLRYRLTNEIGSP